MRRTNRQRRVFWLTFGVGLAVVAVALLAYWWPVYAAIARYEPAEGDVVFQSLPPSPLVNTIEGVTRSPYSHCGLVALRNGQWVVVEALDGVEETPLRAFLIRGRNHGFAVYRLREQHQSAVAETISNARRYLGRPYDVRYQMDDEKIYCSELIYKAFRDATNGQELGRLVRLGELNWKPYVEAIEHFEGGPVPLEREMISPIEMARSSQLQLVMNWRFPTAAAQGSTPD